MVEEDHIVCFISHKLQRFLSAYGSIYFYHGFLEEIFDHIKVHDGIIHNQYICVLSRELLTVFPVIGQSLLPSVVYITHRLIS